jgi:hypothetical protein
MTRVLLRNLALRQPSRAEHIVWGRTVIFLFLQLVGCEADSPEKPCRSTRVISTYPSNGDQSVSLELMLEAELENPTGDVTFWVDGGAGGGVVEPVILDGRARYLIPTPLEPDTEYFFRVDSCGEEVAHSIFRTGYEQVGARVAGRVWHFDFIDPMIVWNQPPSPIPLSLLTGGLATTRGILFEVEEVTGSEIEIVGGLSELVDGSLVQHRCTSPGRFPPTPFLNDPQFSATTPELEVSDDGEPVVLYDLGVSGTFRDDGRWVEDMRIRAVFDLRQVESAVELGVCDLIRDVLGGDCQLCPGQVEGDEPWCSPLDLQVPRAEEVIGIDVDLSHQPEPFCFE